MSASHTSGAPEGLFGLRLWRRGQIASTATGGRPRGFGPRPKLHSIAISTAGSRHRAAIRATGLQHRAVDCAVIPLTPRL